MTTQQLGLALFMMWAASGDEPPASVLGVEAKFGAFRDPARVMDEVANLKWVAQEYCIHALFGWGSRESKSICAWRHRELVETLRQVANEEERDPDHDETDKVLVDLGEVQMELALADVQGAWTRYESALRLPWQTSDQNLARLQAIGKVFAPAADVGPVESLIISSSEYLASHLATAEFLDSARNEPVVIQPFEA